jgi:hypothetical protein
MKLAGISRIKKQEYLKDKINDLAMYCKNKEIPETGMDE